MKKYCFDTSGLSNPLEFMPEDIHTRLWSRLREFVESGAIAVTTEIYDEMKLLPGSIGENIKGNKNNLVLEVGEDHWDWGRYIEHSNRMQDEHGHFISEFTGGSNKTICLNDLSIIILAKTLSLPVVSMEGRISLDSPTKRKIPNICDSESVIHMTFNEFLRSEGMQF